MAFARTAWWWFFWISVFLFLLFALLYELVTESWVWSIGIVAVFLFILAVMLYLFGRTCEKL